MPDAAGFYQDSGFDAGVSFAGSCAPAARRFPAEKACAQFPGYGDPYCLVGKASRDFAYAQAR